MSKFQGVIDAAKSREDTAAAKPASLGGVNQTAGEGETTWQAQRPGLRAGHCLHVASHPPGVKIALLKEGRGQSSVNSLRAYLPSGSSRVLKI